MSEIESIQALIHPDFLLMQELKSADSFVHHSNEEELRDRWDMMAVAVAKDPNSRLVYMTWLCQSEINKGDAGLSNPWKDLDYERLKTYELIIGDRMIVAPLYPRYTLEITGKILMGQTLTKKTALYMQGEWTDACVRREGRGLADLLGIEKNNRIIVADNSRFSWESKNLLEWHHNLRGPIPRPLKYPLN